MNKRILTTVAMAALTCALIAPIGSAAAQGGGAAANRAGPQAQQRGDGRIVLRRDGDRAVPFAPVVPVATSSDEPFDFGDALVGAAAACASLTVALACVWVIRRRRTAEYLVRRPA